MIKLELFVASFAVYPQCVFIQAGTSTPSEQLNLEQLEITLTLNRADIAREKIFLENKKWKKGQLNDYMYQALMSDRHDFVKLFLEQGFSLEEFLTVYMLEKLYTDQLKHMVENN
ncbi:Transient receptor putative cation channel subfamily M member 2 [Cichlidogyrus casuarinus]|uniref:Transient receptor putative cation channel subfamily M member 2 n=1 Tax=Cichlidogyrus casuarinus TaxID=1844966 RepID=A0ABD2QKF5_9PLAT